MNRLPRELTRMWRGDRGLLPFVLGALTAPLSAAFGVAVRGRNLLYDAGLLASRRAPLPVVSVGNLAVGGAGKTPVSAWVARTLEQAGRRPAIVLRGYGDDEPLLHARWNPSVPVLRAPRRIQGVEEAARQGRDVVVLDDGYQHRALHRDVNLLLLSPAHHLPPRLLPRGPFRESLMAMRRADRILITAKGDHELEGARALADEVGRIPGLAPVEVFAFRAGSWENLHGAPEPPPPGDTFVVTSVAEPSGFVHLVTERTGRSPRSVAFRDHHAFSARDADWISRAAESAGWISVTEKDAVKLLPLEALLPPARVLPLVPVPPPDLGPWIVDAVAAERTGATRP